MSDKSHWDDIVLAGVGLIAGFAITKLLQTNTNKLDDNESYNDNNDDEEITMDNLLSEDKIQKITEIISQYAPSKWRKITLEAYVENYDFSFYCEASDIDRKKFEINIDHEELTDILLFPMLDNDVTHMYFKVKWTGKYSLEFD